MKEQTTMIAVRLPDEWVRITDEEAERLSREHGIKFTRTDVIRMCVAKRFGLTTTAPEATAEPQPT